MQIRCSEGWPDEVGSWMAVDEEPTPEEIARASAIAKLQALGLTEEEALALVGG
jgi:hypothetical protein